MKMPTDSARCKHGSSRLRFAFCILSLQRAPPGASRSPPTPARPFLISPQSTSRCHRPAAACARSEPCWACAGASATSGCAAASSPASSGRPRCGSRASRRSASRSSFSPRRAAAVLLLPRESRVLRGQPAEAILERADGVDLAPADLQAILTGCVVPDPMADGGRAARQRVGVDRSAGRGHAVSCAERRSGRFAPRAATAGRSSTPAASRASRHRCGCVADLAEGSRGPDRGAVSELEANVDLDPSGIPA